MKTYHFFLLCLLFTIVAAFTTTQSLAQTPGRVLLNVDYENQQLNSGITGVSGTHATASDASYIVSPGANGTGYAIAHKMVYGDNGYFSDGSYRSESDAVALSSARFSPGQERRYEFSVLLKDWTPWVSGSTYETNIFQLKVSDNSSGDTGVPLQFRTARNALRLRYVGSTSIKDIITDLRPLVNKWMHFRIDVLWADGPTGYMKTYMKLPGENNYTLVDEKTNYTTFAGNVNAGNVGYIKWGGYGLQEGLTRITYHDDIRIIDLNNTSTAPPVYANDINGVTDFINPITTGNLLDPNVESSGANAPSCHYSVGNLTPSTNLSGRVLLSGWTAGTPAAPSPLNSTQYYEFKVAPKSGYRFSFENIKFTVLRGSATQPNTFALRSSVDNFATDISSPVVITATGTTNPPLITFNAAALNNVTGPITFRLYAYGSTGSGTQLVGLNDFQFLGQVLPNIVPTSLNKLSAYTENNTINVNWSTNSEHNNDYFEVQLSKDGKNFSTIQTIKSKNGNSNSLQSYETQIYAKEFAKLLSLPLLLCFIGINKPSKRKTVMWLAGIILLFGVSLSCKKNKNMETVDQQMYLRLKQVDLDGKFTYSDVIPVSIKK